MGNDSRIRSTLNCERGMKPISGIVNSISELIGQLTLPAREKRELEIGLLKLIQELERELTQARAVAVQEEVKGNWLQRSWRPLVMLTFASVILIGTFTSLPLLFTSKHGIILTANFLPQGPFFSIIYPLAPSILNFTF